MTRLLTILALAAAGLLSGCLVAAEHRPTAGNPASSAPPAERPVRVVYEDATRSISIGYTDADGFRDAQEEAPRYCGARYGRASAELLSDDRAAGRVTFACGLE